MRKPVVSLIIVSLFLITFPWNANAQEVKGGTVEYDQFNYHKYEKREGGGSERYNNFIAKLPSTTKDLKVLVFTTKKSLYKHSLKPEDPVLARMKKGIQRVNMLKPPTVKINSVYIDLDKGVKIRQLSFMARFFLMEEKTNQTAWKIGSDQVKIQGYTCQNAIMQKGEQTITAWFTPEIPVSVGPAEYEGLPGLILSIEVNGQNTILATSVDLTKPDDKLRKIKEGAKVDQEKMDQIVAEKIEEWKKTARRRGTQRGGGGR